MMPWTWWNAQAMTATKAVLMATVLEVATQWNLGGAQEATQWTLGGAREAVYELEKASFHTRLAQRLEKSDFS